MLQEKDNVIKQIIDKKDDVINQKDTQIKELFNDLKANSKELLQAVKTYEKENARLEYSLKSITSDYLQANQVITVRAAIESIMYLKYKHIKGTQERINQETNTECFQAHFKTLCTKLKCLNYSQSVLPNLYNSISTHAHGGGHYVDCHLKDSTFSPAEWAAIISIFKCNLPKEDFKVYGKDDKEIDL
ncbi:hypothetical protein HDV06_001531 [Boothiomyces sp. JEL0866]|nr:hypothetical protein HDV06_001531 [Boothiomyces sp. JEL0866]